MTVENLLLETGDDLLLETGDGIFLESYVPPNRSISVSAVVSFSIVTEILRPNTPKFMTVGVVVGTVVETLTVIYSSAPAKTLSESIVVLPFAVSIGNITSTAIPYRRPVRHLVWVYDHRGFRVNVLD